MMIMTKRDTTTTSMAKMNNGSSTTSRRSLFSILIILLCCSSVGNSSSDIDLGRNTIISKSSSSSGISSYSDDEQLLTGDGSAMLIETSTTANYYEDDHHGNKWRRWKSYDDDEFGDEEAMEVVEEEWEMVERKGKQFVMKESGRPFYINGFNTYWLMIFAVDPSTRSKVTEVFQQASSVGLTVCRTWAFNDGGWRALQKSPSVYDEDVFKGLDFVLNEAKKYKIRLILSFVNNWDAFGGRPQYVKWGNEAGLNLTSDDDFFSHPTLKTYYKNHVQTVLTRVNTVTNVTYKDDPTIFAWELMNEPRCVSDPSGDKLQAWIQEMAMHVKSIDQKHLLEIGLEGFYGPSTPDRVGLNPNTFAQQVGTDFVRNHQALGVDFASAHIYADSWISQSISEAHIQFVKTWMTSHIEDAEKKLGGMPVVFAEFGVCRKDNGYNSSFKDALISTVYKTILDSTKKGGSGGGSLIWQLFPDGTDYMDDGYAVVLSKAQSTANIMSLQSTRLTMFNSLCSMRCHWGCSKKKKNKNHTEVSTLIEDNASVSPRTMHDEM